MVQITPLLQIISAAAQGASSQNAPASNGLVARQSFDPSQLPSSCQSSCQVINTMGNCGSTISCMCASSVGSNLQSCMNCLVSYDPSVSTEAQQAISGWNQLCGGNLSLSGGTTGGTTGGTGGTTGGTTGGSSGSSTPSDTIPPSATGTSSGGSNGGPIPKLGTTSGAVGPRTVSVGVCIAAVAIGAFMTL